jgi:hypothetical protein
MSKIKAPETDSISAKDVLKLFESEYSQEVYDRKASEVMKYITERSDGFFFYELADLTKMTVIAVPTPGNPLGIHTDRSRERLRP